MTAKQLSHGGALLLLLAAAVLAAIGDPTLEDKLARQSGELDELLASGEWTVDPGEVVAELHNNRSKVVILDVRSDRDYNLFHVWSADRVELEDLPALAPSLPTRHAVVFLMSNDEARAREAWRVLRVLGVENAYVVTGGVNLWLAIYREGHHEAVPVAGRDADGTLRYAFDLPRGDAWPFARPDPHEHPRAFEKKVKIIGPAPREGGGCG